MLKPIYRLKWQKANSSPESIANLTEKTPTNCNVMLIYHPFSLSRNESNKYCISNYLRNFLQFHFVLIQSFAIEIVLIT